MPKAAVATGVDQPLEIIDVDLDDPKAGEVRVEHGRLGRLPLRPLGRERHAAARRCPRCSATRAPASSTQVGEGVDHLKVGDHVVVSWVPQCGECYMCTHDQGEMCEVGFMAMAMSGGLLDMTPRFARDGAPLYQMAALGHVLRGDASSPRSAR